MESIVLTSQRLQVGFHWHEDRYAHTIGVFRGERLVPLLASLEGCVDEHWPPSPALQTIHRQKTADGNIAMLVGMAGRNHWSLSVELNDRWIARFEVACRIKVSAQCDEKFAVGSRYRTMIEPEIVAGGEQVGFRLADEFLAVSPGESKNAVPRFVTADGVIKILPDDQSENLPRTVTWSYLVSVA